MTHDDFCICFSSCQVNIFYHSFSFFSNKARMPHSGSKGIRCGNTNHATLKQGEVQTQQLHLRLTLGCKVGITNIFPCFLLFITNQWHGEKVPQCHNTSAIEALQYWHHFLQGLAFPEVRLEEGYKERCDLSDVMTKVFWLLTLSFLTSFSFSFSMVTAFWNATMSDARKKERSGMNAITITFLSLTPYFKSKCHKYATPAPCCHFLEVPQYQHYFPAALDIPKGEEKEKDAWKGMAFWMKQLVFSPLITLFPFPFSLLFNFPFHFFFNLTTNFLFPYSDSFFINPFLFHFHFKIVDATNDTMTPHSGSKARRLPQCNTSASPSPAHQLTIPLQPHTFYVTKGMLRLDMTNNVLFPHCLLFFKIFPFFCNLFFFIPTTALWMQ